MQVEIYDRHKDVTHRDNKFVHEIGEELGFSSKAKSLLIDLDKNVWLMFEQGNAINLTSNHRGRFAITIKRSYD